MYRILAKAAVDLPSAVLTLGAANVTFRVQPLFRNIGRQAAFGAAAADVWQIFTPIAELSDQNAWDVCHALMRGGFGVAGAPAAKFAEPDLQQRWIAGQNVDLALTLAQSCDKPDPQSTEFPRLDDNYWFRDSAHSQFGAAIDAIGGPNVVPKVRIAHFDTGYDPKHRTLPKHLRPDMARNYVDGGEPNEATDETTGPLTNLGHGTGTLSLLAGASRSGEPLLGGAPFAEIVPVRVANSVVLFYNSAIAQAFDYVHGVNAGAGDHIDIITMSMGGLASQAWADAVNALYEQGVFIVTAAGNNFGNLPTHNIVYPARFGRVVAACGIMANGQPYADLGFRLMAGNYGPDSKMSTAIAAATPNVPWARLGCEDIVDFDGAGTSAATPQVAAAAAVWLQKNRAAVDGYPKPWMRVEAVRAALFGSAKANAQETRRLGRGELCARDALDKAPVAAASLAETAADSASFAIFRVLGGLGIQAVSGPQQQMLELEALQLSQTTRIESILPDPTTASEIERRQFAEALATDPRASKALRLALADVVRRPQITTQGASMSTPANADPVALFQLTNARNPRMREPAYRPLRVYAYDPSVGARLETLDINEAILNVRWEEDLKPGPIGEYIEVIDVDPASQCCYAPVDLNDPHILAVSGFSPSEANPQFHQQMAYAVAMKTIEHFEKALGRVALWAIRRGIVAGEWKTEFVPRLRIYPHALRAQNAYYSPERNALLLGYFNASRGNVGTTLPEGVVFTAVSHDIIAHETTHALLHGLHLRSIEPTNPDVFAFHEAFADIVALFQHFTLPEALKQQIATTRGDLEKKNLLGQIGIQFGEATGRFGALRDYVGKMVNVKEEDHNAPMGEQAAGDGTGDEGPEGETWIRRQARQTDYSMATEAHARGAVLVAAVFDAFLQIYKRRKADLLRLATEGTGVLPAGDIPVDLVNRLSREASKVAGQILNICIRALDYCPPVDLTFGEYLRAVVTADADLVRDDRYGYRTAIVGAFRDRGIYPSDVKHLSPGSLIWEPPPVPIDPDKLKAIIKSMSLDWDLYNRRKDAFDLSQKNAAMLWSWLMDRNKVTDEEVKNLGLLRIDQPQPWTIDGVPGELRKIEVHSVRPARRVGPDGNLRSDIVIEVSQTFRPSTIPTARCRGGSTLLIDLATFELRYLIRKKLRLSEFVKSQLSSGIGMNYGLRSNYFDDSTLREPFALVHGVFG